MLGEKLLPGDITDDRRQFFLRLYTRKRELIGIYKDGMLMSDSDDEKNRYIGLYNEEHPMLGGDGKVGNDTSLEEAFNKYIK